MSGAEVSTELARPQSAVTGRQKQKRLPPLARVSLLWQGVGGPAYCGDWLCPVLATGLWFVLVSLFMDKLPRTPGLSGGFAVRSFSQNGPRCLTPIQTRALRDSGPCPVISLLGTPHLHILGSSPSCCCHLSRWPVPPGGLRTALNLQVLAVIGLTSSAHNRRSIIVS